MRDCKKAGLGCTRSWLGRIWYSRTLVRPSESLSKVSAEIPFCARVFSMPPSVGAKMVACSSALFSKSAFIQWSWIGQSSVLKNFTKNEASQNAMVPSSMPLSYLVQPMRKRQQSWTTWKCKLMLTLSKEPRDMITSIAELENSCKPPQLVKNSMLASVEIRCDDRARGAYKLKECKGITSETGRTTEKKIYKLLTCNDVRFTSSLDKIEQCGEVSRLLQKTQSTLTLGQTGARSRGWSDCGGYCWCDRACRDIWYEGRVNFACPTSNWRT